MRQLRKLLLVLPAVLFITAPNVHGKSYIQAVYNWIQGKDQQLFQAAQEGDTERVQELIDNGANINAQDDHGNTPLHDAAYWGCPEVAQLLIDNGTNVDVQNFIGETPLFDAIRSENQGMIHLLIRNGADINTQAYPNVDIEKLIDPLNIKSPTQMSRKKRKMDVVIGRTPLHIAAVVGHAEIAQLLIHNGAHVNVQNNENSTPLHFAATFGHTETAHLLIRNGAYFDIRDRDKDTPYQLAQEQGLTDITKLCDRKRIAYQLSLFSPREWRTIINFVSSHDNTSTEIHFTELDEDTRNHIVEYILDNKMLNTNASQHN